MRALVGRSVARGEGGICARSSVLLAFLHPQNSAVPQVSATGRWKVLVFRCGLLGGLHPASPLPLKGPQPPLSLPTSEREMGEGKGHMSPRDTPNRLVAHGNASFLQTEQMRTREGTCLNSPSQDNGRAEKGSGLFWALAACVAHTPALLYFHHN